MRSYYRISDKSYPKDKLIGADKRTCLLNFLDTFRSEIKIIADRCEGKTLDWLHDLKVDIVETDFGNAGSLHYAMDLAIKECSDDDLIYFCEDDYLHQSKSKQLLQEGQQISDYLTLYDHPDKYTNLYELGEVSKVVRTQQSHWRYTISTCMTFAVNCKILKEDIEIFKKHVGIVDDKKEHPVDHEIFCELKEKGRKLAVCIPGTACHTDLTFSGMTGVVLIEPWAIEMMIVKLDQELEFMRKKIKEKEEFDVMKNQILSKYNGWKKLVGMDALLKSCPES